jgi:hypothetical protein
MYKRIQFAIDTAVVATDSDPSIQSEYGRVHIEFPDLIHCYFRFRASNHYIFTRNVVCD